MKTRNGVVAVIAAIGMGGAGCKLDVNSMLKKPGGGGSPSSGSTASSSGSTASSSGSTASSSSSDDSGGAAAEDITRELAKVEPAPGVARVEPVRPSWCHAVAPDDIEGRDVNGGARQMENMLGPSGYWWSGSKATATLLCVNPDGRNVQQQTAYLLQYWVNMTEQSPEEVAAFFTVLVGDYDGEKKKFCPTLAVSDEASTREQKLAQALRASYGCGSDFSPYWASRQGYVDIGWHFDREDAPPSERLRAFEVLQCLPMVEDTIDDRTLAGYALCGTDARALDARKLEQEIAGDSDWGKAIARQSHAAARAHARAFEAVARAKAKADAGWQALLFDVPAKAWKDWTRARDRNERAVHAAISYEDRYDGPSRKAAKGCWGQAWGNLSAYVQAKKPSSVAEAKQALAGTVAPVLLGYAVACAEVEGDSFTQSRLATVLGYARPARGPRWATGFALLDALYEIKSDRAKFAADARWFNRYVGFHPLSSGGIGNIEELDLARDDKGGVVKSVKRDGDAVIVEYKKEKVQESIWDCEYTNRIVGWQASGAPSYQRNCTYQGERWVDDTNPTVRIAAGFAGAIEPGMFLRVSTSSQGDERGPAFPVELWKNKDRKKLIAFMGIEL